MGRSLFIGDSHVCGYVTKPNQVGPGSYDLWQDNNYAELYSIENNNRPTVVYAMPGTTNSAYTDWIYAMLKKYNDIDEIFVLMSAFNRFMLAFDGSLSTDSIPVDYFTKQLFFTSSGTWRHAGKHNVDIYVDLTTKGDKFQLFNKPTQDDYKNFVGISYTDEKGLMIPDLRKHTYMQVKMFFEMNTHLEQREFYKNIYIWNSLCEKRNIKCYLFNMRERQKLPNNYNYYGELNHTVISSVSIEEYFKSENIDHNKYFISDQEHYNKEYHQLIATKFIPWLKNQKSS